MSLQTATRYAVLGQGKEVTTSLRKANNGAVRSLKITSAAISNVT